MSFSLASYPAAPAPEPTPGGRAVNLYQLRIVDLIREGINDGVQVYLVAVTGELHAGLLPRCDSGDRRCRRDLQDLQGTNERDEGAHLPQEAEVEVSKVRESQDANTKIRLESDAVSDSLTGNDSSVAPFRLGGAPERLRHYFSFVVGISCRGRHLRLKSSYSAAVSYFAVQSSFAND
jgi:hypothetical protein